MATTVVEYALGRMNPVTSNPVDLKMAAMILREARRCGELETVRAQLLEGRARYRTWLGQCQRKWQRETRRPSRARHSDSIAIRERYVRCK